MPELLANRDHIAQRYLAEIQNPKVELPLIDKDCKHTWYQFIIRVDNQEKFREFLKERGVNTDISWRVPPFLQPCMVEKYDYKEGDFPITEELCAHIVTLPMMDFMEEDEITAVIDAANAYA